MFGSVLIDIAVILLGFPLVALGAVYAKKLIVEIYHTKRGHFLVELIKPNSKTVKDWFKLEKGCLVKGKKRVVFRDDDGFIRFGGLLGTTPIIIVSEQSGEMMNHKYEIQVYQEPVNDDSGNPVTDDKTGKPLMKNIAFELGDKKDTNITPELLDQFNESAMQQGRLEALVDDTKKTGYALYSLIGVGIVLIVQVMIYGKLA